MQKKNVEKRLLEYNGIIKENDELYRGVARKYGLPDCAFWILYALRESDRTLTQSDICYEMYQPKQTINSSLKKLEREGYITLTEMQDRRSKELHLTKKGVKLAETTVDHVIMAERAALAELTEEEQDTFMKLFHRYTEALKDRIGKLPEKQEET